MGGCGHRRLRQEPEPGLAKEERPVSEGHPAPQIEEGAQDIDRLPGRGQPRPLNRGSRLPHPRRVISSLNRAANSSQKWLTLAS
jgi:hypothetical protein